jgi:hypothetical protein
MNNELQLPLRNNPTVRTKTIKKLLTPFVTSVMNRFRRHSKIKMESPIKESINPVTEYSTPTNLQIPVRKKGGKTRKNRKTKRKQ